MPPAKGEAGEHPALCPQLSAALRGGKSDTRPGPSSVSRPGSAVGRGPTRARRRAPSLRDDKSWNWKDKYA